MINLRVEPCEYGKNIDFKHQELFKNFEKRENESIEKYYCINLIGKNISFFHHPNDNTENYIALNSFIEIFPSLIFILNYFIPHFFIASYHKFSL